MCHKHLYLPIIILVFPSSSKREKARFFIFSKNDKRLACKSSGKVYKSQCGIHDNELGGREDSSTKHFQAFAWNQILHIVQGNSYKTRHKSPMHADSTFETHVHMTDTVQWARLAVLHLFAPQPGTPNSLTLLGCLHLTAMLLNKRAKAQPQAASNSGCQHFLCIAVHKSRCQPCCWQVQQALTVLEGWCPTPFLWVQPLVGLGSTTAVLPRVWVCSSFHCLTVTFVQISHYTTT